MAAIAQRLGIKGLFAGDTRSKEEIELVAKLSIDSKLPPSEVESLRKKFLLCADANSKTLDRTRFRTLLKYYFKQESCDWDGFFRVFDFDSSGQITFEEFVKNLAIILNGPRDQQLELLFKVFDTDKSGVLNDRDLALLAEFLEKLAGEWPVPNTKGKVTVAKFLEKCPDKKTISKAIWLANGEQLEIVQALLTSNESLLSSIYNTIVSPPPMKWLCTSWAKYYYEDVQHLMNTGDIVLYHGRATFSRTIELSSRSFFSHSGMLVRSPSPDLRAKYKCDPNVELFLYDSDLSSMDGRPGGGVQLAPFHAWLKLCADGAEDGLVIVRRLNLPGRDTAKDWIDSPSATFPNAKPFMLKIAGTPYETSRCQLAGAITGGNKEDLTSVFCSELVSGTLRAMGLLPEDFVPSNCSPARLSSKETSKPDSFVQFQRGAYYDREAQIFAYPVQASAVSLK